MGFMVIMKVVFASLLFGLTSRLFSELTHTLKRWYGYVFHNPMVKSAAGGIIIIGLVFLLGTRDYLGLGIPLIEAAFAGEVSPFAFLGKILFTSLTLGAGFQGGEVTPLFAIGATLGSALSEWIGLHAPFLAALGFIAVFCGRQTPRLLALLWESSCSAVKARCICLWPASSATSFPVTPAFTLRSL